MSIPTTLASKHLHMQNKAMRKKKNKIETCKQAKGKRGSRWQEQVWRDVTDGTCCTKPGTVHGGQEPLQSSQEGKLCLAPRTTAIKPDLLTGKHSFLYHDSWTWPPVQARSGKRCGQKPPPSPPISTMVHCYYGPVLPGRKCDQG